MFESISTAVVTLAGVYGLIGLLFAVPFLLWGAAWVQGIAIDWSWT